MGLSSAFVITGTPGATDMALVVVLKGTQSTPLPVVISGSLKGATRTIARKATNVANQVMQATNAARISLTIVNYSSVANLAISYGAVAASFVLGAESFTVVIPKYVAGSPANGYFIDDWSGAVQGISDVADAAGCALVTEVTP